jgi:hypothetical protein
MMLSTLLPKPKDLARTAFHPSIVKSTAPQDTGYYAAMIIQ